MSRLAGGIPRGLQNHRSRDGGVYGDYLRAKVKRLGPLPKDAWPLLREAGLLVLDLARLRDDQERYIKRGWRKQARTVDRRLVPLRTQLLTIETRLEEIAARHRPERTADDMLRELIAESQREQAGDGQ